MDIITYALCKKLADKSGSIKDRFLDSVSIETVTTPDVPEPGYIVGEKYFHFVFKVGSAFLKEINLRVSDILPVINEYIGGDAIVISKTDDDNIFSINIDIVEKKGLKIDNDKKLQAFIDEEIVIFDEESGAITLDLDKLNEILGDIYVPKAGCEMDNNAFLTISEENEQKELTGNEATYDALGLKAVGASGNTAEYTADGITIENTDNKTEITVEKITTTGTVEAVEDVLIGEGEDQFSVKKALEDVPTKLSDLENDIGAPEEYTMTKLSAEGEPEKYSIKWLETVNGELEEKELILLEEEDERETENIIFDRPDFNI